MRFEAKGLGSRPRPAGLMLVLLILMLLLLPMHQIKASYRVSAPRHVSSWSGPSAQGEECKKQKIAPNMINPFALKLSPPPPKVKYSQYIITGHIMGVLNIRAGWGERGFNVRGKGLTNPPTPPLIMNTPQYPIIMFETALAIRIWRRDGS